MSKCPLCFGTGQRDDRNCSFCEGTGEDLSAEGFAGGQGRSSGEVAGTGAALCVLALVAFACAVAYALVAWVVM